MTVSVRREARVQGCSAFEAYHQQYVDEVQPRNVVEFLLLSPTYPRIQLNNSIQEC